MIIFAVSLALLLYICMVGSMSVRPHHPRLSAFELQRRKKEEVVAVELRRQAHYGHVAGALRLGTLMATVGWVVIAVVIVGWLNGLLLALAGVVAGSALASQMLVRKSLQRLYDRCENTLLQYMEKYQQVVRWFRVELHGVSEQPLASRQELDHLLKQADTVLSRDERQMLRRGLEVSRMTVADVMTPKAKVVTVHKGDVVGPLLLDELHKTGYRQFPVVEDETDQICGVLYINDLLTLQDKKTRKVASLMMKPAQLIAQTHTLEELLGAFSATHHYMLIVVDSDKHPAGVVTLADALRGVLGRNVKGRSMVGDDA